MAYTSADPLRLMPGFYSTLA